MPKSIQFMSLDIELASKQEVLTAVEAATPDRPVRIATVNPEFVVEAEHNPAFQKALKQMTHCIIDGSGLFFALKLGQFFDTHYQGAEHYHGSDLTEDLFRRHQHGEKKFFLLGGQPGVAKEAERRLREHYPSLKVVGATDGGIIDPHHIEVTPELAAEINAAKPDVLLVGFGAPKQELWITAAREILAVPVMIGIGGTIDFYSVKKRAPSWMRSLHLEWLYRSISEQGHWKRAYRATVVFPLRAFGWILATKVLRGKDTK